MSIESDVKAFEAVYLAALLINSFPKKTVAIITHIIIMKTGNVNGIFITLFFI